MEASVVGGSAVLEEKSLVVGSWLDLFDTAQEKWYPARIVEEEERRVRVQFYGWAERHNRWIDKVRRWPANGMERNGMVWCFFGRFVVLA